MQPSHLVLLFSLAVPGAAGAESIREMLENDRNVGLVKLRIASLADGIGWANSYFAVKHNQRIYCPPGKLAITSDQHLSILRRFVVDHPADGDRPAGEAGHIVIKALMDAFPCD